MSNQFNEGDEVLYMPPNQHNNPESWETGVVTEVRKTGYLVDYDDASPNAKLTREKDLYPPNGK